MPSLGDWSFEAETARLRRGDEDVHLDPKEASVLAHLAEAAPNPVSIDALLERSWPGVFVGDNAVHRVVARLRKAFGDSARKPSYIETLPKRGYRLLVPVGNEHPAARPRSSGPRRTPFATRRRLAAGLALAAIGAAAALYPWAEGPVPEDRVVVMPFITHSTDPRHVHVGRGLHAEVVHSLSRDPGLYVVASREERRHPGSGFALTGSLRPTDGDRLRATIRLEHSDRSIWSRSFQLAGDGVPQTEAEVAELVSMTVSLASDRLYRLRDATTSDGARLAVLRAQLLAGANVLDGAKRALPYYEQAIQLDPDFAEAYALKALTYRTFANWYEMDTRDAVGRMRHLADLALERDPDLPLALILDAELRLFDLDFAQAEASLERGLARTGEPPVYAAIALAHCGRFDEALAIVERGIQANPVHPRYLHHLKGQFLWYARRHAEALAVFDEILAVAPTDVRAKELRAYVLQSLGRHAEAAEALPAAFPHLYDWVPEAYAAGGMHGIGQGFLQLAANIEEGRVPFVPPPSAWRMYLRGYALLGDPERAVASMEEGWSLDDRWEFFYNRVYPWPGFDEVRAHPAFAELMARTIGNPPGCPGSAFAAGVSGG